MQSHQKRCRRHSKAVVCKFLRRKGKGCSIDASDPLAQVSTHSLSLTLVLWKRSPWCVHVCVKVYQSRGQPFRAIFSSTCRFASHSIVPKAANASNRNSNGGAFCRYLMIVRWTGNTCCGSWGCVLFVLQQWPGKDMRVRMQFWWPTRCILTYKLILTMQSFDSKNFFISALSIIDAGFGNSCLWSCEVPESRPVCQNKF